MESQLNYLQYKFAFVFLTADKKRTHNKAVQRQSECILAEKL